MTEIVLSNGDIITLEGDETPQEIQALKEKIAAFESQFEPQQMTLGEKIGGAARKFTQGTSMGFGDELVAGMGALASMPFTGQSFSDAYNLALDRERSSLNQMSQEMPVTSAALELAGGVTGGVGLGKGLVQGGAKIAPNLMTKGAELATKNIFTKGATAAALGAGSGGVYGYGTGTGGVSERTEQAAEAGKFGAAAGVAGAALAPVLRPVAKSVGRTFSKAPQQQTAQTSNAIVERLGMLKKQQSILPMTKGQLTQDVGSMQLEDIARKGGIGEDAQKIIQGFDERQQQEIFNFVDNIAQGADEVTELNKAAAPLRKAYKSLKMKINQAYDDAKVLDKTYIHKQPLVESLSPKIRQAADDFGVTSIQDLDAGLQDVYKSLTNSPLVKDPKINAVKLSVLEDTRKRLNNIISKNTDTITREMTPSGVFATRLKSALDETMTQIPKDAFKAGDVDALEKIMKARNLRAQKGRLFDSNKIISDIVKNDTLNNEQLANIILTGSKAGKSVNTNTVNVIRSMKAAAGDNAPEMINNVKRGLFAKVLNNSYGTSLRQGVDELRIEPNKLIRELKKVTENKSLMRELFDADEQAYLNQGLDDLVRINSPQKGGENYSNTALFLKRFTDMIPGVRQLVSEPLQSMSNAATAESLELATNQFANELQRALRGGQSFYGSMATAPISGALGAYTTQTQKDIEEARRNFYMQGAQ